MTKYHISVKPIAKESLSPLLRQLVREFPELDEIVDTFQISEGKRPIFGAGEPHINEIVIIWKIEKPDQASLQVIERVLEIIKNSSCGSAEIVVQDKTE